MTATEKFCKDCRWCPTTRPNEDTRCGHRAAEQWRDTYVLDGFSRPLRDPNLRCVSMRGGICLDGRLWEERIKEAA